MNKSLEKCVLSGEISAMSSKSYAHRMMLCAMLTDSRVCLSGLRFSKDIEATKRVAAAFGANIRVEGTSYFFEGRNKVESAVADCIESGSTLRFCIPLAGALGIDTVFKGSERLLSRPNAALFACLEKHGVKIENYRLTGKLSSGRYEIDSSVSSQYVTGLLMALPLLDGDSEIVLTGEIVSKGYVDITLDVLNIAGIAIDKKDERHYYIKGNQTYRMMENVNVNGDWSNAAFFLAAGAFSEKGITVSGLQKDKQGDAAVLNVLKDFGAEVKVDGDKVFVRKGEYKPIEVDVEYIPDLAPIISVLCAAAEGKSVIKNVDRLRIKESDRLTAIIENLSAAGVKSEYKNNSLIVFGTGKIGRGKYCGYNDHRMVMSAAVLCSLGGGEISGTEAIEKSYPDFFDDYKKTGGKIL